MHVLNFLQFIACLLPPFILSDKMLQVKWLKQRTVTFAPYEILFPLEVISHQISFGPFYWIDRNIGTNVEL